MTQVGEVGVFDSVPSVHLYPAAPVLPLVLVNVNVEPLDTVAGPFVPAHVALPTFHVRAVPAGTVHGGGGLQVAPTAGVLLSVPLSQ